MTEPEDEADGPRTPFATGQPVRPSDTATDPGRAHPYESLYRSPGDDAPQTHRVTRRDHEPSLSPPEGQSESGDPFEWLYRPVTDRPDADRPDTEAAPRRALDERDDAEAVSEPVDREPADEYGENAATEAAPPVATTGEWTAIPVGHLDPVPPPPDAKGGRGVTAFLVVLLVLAVLGVGLGIALALRSNQAAHRQAAVQPTASVPSGVVPQPSQQDSTQQTSHSTSPAASTPPTASTSPPASSSAPYAGAVTPAAASSATAQCHAAPATDGRGMPVRYDPQLLVDGDTSTAWRCNRGGKGEQVVLTFASVTKVAEVGLINGYSKVDPKTGEHRYPEYRRVTAVTWTFPNGKTFDQSLADGNEGVQTLRIPVQTTDQVTLTIETTTKPGLKAKTRDAVLISEVAFGSPSG